MIFQRKYYYWYSLIFKGSNTLAKDLNQMINIKCSYSFEFQKGSYSVNLDSEIIPINYKDGTCLYINLVEENAFVTVYNILTG